MLKVICVLAVICLCSPGVWALAEKKAFLTESDPVLGHCIDAQYHVPAQYCWHPTGESVEDPDLGSVHIPNSKVRQVLVESENNKVAFDVTYVTDHLGRRVTPINDIENRNQHAIFHGCSFVFGTGIESHETLPYLFAEQAKNYRPYNYAIGSSGPHVMLAQMEQKNWAQDINESTGVFVYVYADFHVPRANGYLMETQWNFSSPYYEWREGRLHRQGSFASGRPLTTSLYKFLGAKLKLPQLLGRNFPKRRVAHEKLTCELIKAAKAKYLERFAQGRFIVLKHPQDGGPSSVISCLEKAKIEVLSIDLRLSPHDPSYKVPLDGHPNKKLNGEIAFQLARIINAKSQSAETRRE